MDDTRVATWERLAQWPLLVASVLFLVAYAWPVVDPSLPRGVHVACTAVVRGTWVLLAVDLGVRVALSRRRWAFLRTHPVEVASVLLPALRPLQLVRTVAVLGTLNRYAGSSLRGRVGVYAGGAVGLIVLMGTLAILDAERPGPGPIDTVGDALWWSLTTITTVGYGDMYPVTTEGRLVAVGLMFAGIGVLGVVTASFASWLVERVDELDEMQDGVSATRADVESLREEVVRLREALERGRP